MKNRDVTLEMCFFICETNFTGFISVDRLSNAFVQDQSGRVRTEVGVNNKLDEHDNIYVDY